VASPCDPLGCDEFFRGGFVRRKASGYRSRGLIHVKRRFSCRQAHGRKQRDQEQRYDIEEVSLVDPRDLRRSYYQVPEEADLQ